MSTFLFFDTETTVIADFKAPHDAPHQPRLVQLAAILAADDGAELASVDVMIRPHGFDIPIEATAIHGITTADAVTYGVPLFHALSLFSSLARVASDYVCHNYEFDSLVMRGECERLVVEYPVRTGNCTMRLMTDVCQLPGPYGFKWPSLAAAYRHCFQKELVDAHDALADVRACKEVFFWQRNQGKAGQKFDPNNAFPNGRWT